MYKVLFNAGICPEYRGCPKPYPLSKSSAVVQSSCRQAKSLKDSGFGSSQQYPNLTLTEDSGRFSSSLSFGAAGTS